MKKKINKRVNEIQTPQGQRREEFYRGIDENRFDLREAILQYRYLLDMNQERFAQFTKVPLKTLRDFEQNKANPTLNTLERMLIGSGLEISVRRKQ